MLLVIRIVVAVLAGLITSGLLNYFGVLNAHLNGLIGLFVGLCVFFGYDGTIPGRKVV